MDLTRVEWRGGMSCGGSSGEAGAGDLGMATGRVRIGFFYIRTRPAGQDS